MLSKSVTYRCTKNAFRSYLHHCDHSFHESHYYSEYTIVILPPHFQMYQSKHCLHLKPNGVSKLCALNLVRLQSKTPSRLGNFSFNISIIAIRKHSTFVSVKSYTIITIDTIILKIEISLQLDTM